MGISNTPQKHTKMAKITLPDVPEYEAAEGGVDLSEFEGQRAKLNRYEVIDGKSNFDEAGKPLPTGQTRPVKNLKVYSEPITQLTKKDGTVIDVCATELLNMNEKDSVWGISTHEKSKAARLMKQLKVNHLKDVIGKEVIVKTRGDDANFLGFVIK